MLHRRNLVVRNFKVEIDLRKEIFFWVFSLNFECVFGFLLIFEQKHVLRHKCAILLFTFFWSFEIWFFCILNLILTFQCIPDCELLINLIMSCCFEAVMFSKKKMVQVFYLKTLFSECYFLFLKLKGGTGFAKGTICF